MIHQALRDDVVCGHYHPTRESADSCAKRMGPKWQAETRASFSDIPLTLGRWHVVGEIRGMQVVRDARGAWAVDYGKDNGLIEENSEMWPRAMQDEKLADEWESLKIELIGVNQ